MIYRGFLSERSAVNVHRTDDDEYMKRDDARRSSIISLLLRLRGSASSEVLSF